MKKVLHIAVTSICLLLLLLALLPVLEGGVARAAGSIDTWSSTGNLNVARAGYTATLLKNGQVLVAGGFTVSSTPYVGTNTAELYDPSSGTWTPTGSLNVARTGHTATLLPDGKVLVAGGFDSNGFVTATAELYDPSSGTNGTWTRTGNLNTGHGQHTATLLPNTTLLDPE